MFGDEMIDEASHKTAQAIVARGRASGLGQDGLAQDGSPGRDMGGPDRDIGGPGIRNDNETGTLNLRIGCITRKTRHKAAMIFSVTENPPRG
jgi:hypothetical protein